MTPEMFTTCPKSQSEIVNIYFMEHRAKLIDIAAYLDRIDRGTTGELDFRHAAFIRALQVLLSDQPNRTKRILELFSSTDPCIPQSAHGLKGASGAAQTEQRSS